MKIMQKMKLWRHNRDVKRHPFKYISPQQEAHIKRIGICEWFFVWDIPSKKTVINMILIVYDLLKPFDYYTYRKNGATHGRLNYGICKFKPTIKIVDLGIISTSDELHSRCLDELLNILEDERKEVRHDSKY